jgi:hypothetical protein
MTSKAVLAGFRKVAKDMQRTLARSTDVKVVQSTRGPRWIVESVNYGVYLHRGVPGKRNMSPRPWAHRVMSLKKWDRQVGVEVRKAAKQKVKGINRGTTARTRRVG